MSNDVPQFVESLGSAALDAARISCQTASALIGIEGKLDDARLEQVMDHIVMARALLDRAREIIGWEGTSIHHVPGERTESGLIIPGV